MKCFSPYVRRFAGYDFPFFLPCGQCPACRSNSARDWAFRIQRESEDFEASQIFFVTLTYAADFVPSDYSLVPSHLTDWLKRVRKRLDYPIRFFACGEYGDRLGRPHYHAILFGLKKEDIIHLGIGKSDWLRGMRPAVSGSGYDVAWYQGFVEIEAPRSLDSVSSYIASYVTKKLRVKEYHSRFPPFHRQSLGLGKSFVDKLPFYTPLVNVNGYMRSLGKYLRRKLAEKFNILDDVVLRGKEYLNFLTEEILSSVDYIGYVSPPKNAVPFHLEKFAYQRYYSGVFALQEAKLKLSKIRMDL
jgi:hypothetical protein